MKLSTRGQYSVKALLDLSLQAPHQPTSVRAIAQRQGLPVPYLEKLLAQLRRAGLVTSVRGVQGGYALALPAGEISVGQILRAVGETLQLFPGQAPDPSHPEDWVTTALWGRLQTKLQAALEEITLAELYYDTRSRQAGAEGNFLV